MLSGKGKKTYSKSNLGFIGTDEIIALEELTDVTPMGEKIVKVLLEDKDPVVLTEKSFKNMRSDQPLDEHNVLTLLRDRKVDPIVREILILLAEANLTLDEVEPCLNKVAMSLNQNMEKAQNELWGVEEGGHRSLLSIDNILKGNGPKDY